jgi:PHD/YefM family antitoxin component YafN of YafNO toxin-antitoxin module
MQAVTLNEATQDLLSVIMSLDDFNAWQDTVYYTPSSSGRRKPSAKIADKGEILGDIITPVVAIEDSLCQLNNG